MGVIATIVIILYTDWKLGIICLLPLVLGMLGMSILMKLVSKDFMKQYMDSLEEMSRQATDSPFSLGIDSDTQEKIIVSVIIVLSVWLVRLIILAISSMDEQHGVRVVKAQRGWEGRSFSSRSGSKFINSLEDHHVRHRATAGGWAAAPAGGAALAGRAMTAGGAAPPSQALTALSLVFLLS